MKARKLLVSMVVVTAAALVATSAFAGCIPPKNFSSWNTGTGVYKYVYMGDASQNGANLVGSYWDTDTPGSADNGSYPAGEWLLGNSYAPGTDNWYLNGNLGDARSGCPTGSMTVEVSNLVTGAWFTATADEFPGQVPDFDFSLLPNIDATGVNARPVVNSSGRAGDIVNLNVTVGAGAVFGPSTVDSTGIYQEIGPDGVPPADRNIGPLWTQIGSIPGNGGTTDVGVDCSGVAPGDNAFVGTAYTVGGVLGTIAGPVTEVECDATLADPSGDRFKLIDRDNLGKGKGAKRNR